MKIKYVDYQTFKKNKEDVKRFDFKNMPVFPKSEECTVNQIVMELRNYIRIYGHISIVDMYDVVEKYEPSLTTIKHYKDNLRGWKYINDIYILHVNDGITIGIRCEPIVLD